jgi:hypothetical protein
VLMPERVAVSEVQLASGVKVVLQAFIW